MDSWSLVEPYQYCLVVEPPSGRDVRSSSSSLPFTSEAAMYKKIESCTGCTAGVHSPLRSCLRGTAVRPTSSRLKDAFSFSISFWFPSEHRLNRHCPSAGWPAAPTMRVVEPIIPFCPPDPLLSSAFSGALCSASGCDVLVEELSGDSVPFGFSLGLLLVLFPAPQVDLFLSRALILATLSAAPLLALYQG